MPNTDVGRQLIWLLLLFYLFASPLLPLAGIPIAWQSVPLMDWQRLFEAIILFFCMAWALTLPRRAIPAPALYGWASVFLLGFLSATLVAEHVLPSLLEWSWLMLIMVLAGIMHGITLSDRASLDRRILVVALGAGLTYVWWFWKLNAFIYFDPIPEGVFREIVFPGFANVRFFSDFQSLLLLLLPTALYRLTPPGLARFAGAWVISLFFALAFIVGSRGLVLAHLALHVLMLTALGNRYWPFLRSQLRYWAFGLLIFLFLTKLLPVLIGSDSHAMVYTPLMRYDQAFRLDLWLRAWEIIKTHPLLGIGPLHYANLANDIASSPHNFPLQIAAEWGLPAAILVAALLLRHVSRRLKLLRSSTEHEDLDPMLLAMTCAAIAILFAAMLASSPLNYPVSQIAALLCFTYPMEKDPPAQQPAQKMALALPLAGLFSIIMVAGTITTFQSIQERNQCFYYNPWPTDRFAPRFWQQGWLVGPCGPSVSLFSILWEKLAAVRDVRTD